MNPASPREFALDPAAYGLPTRDDLVKLRIWDIHYHGFYAGGIRAARGEPVLRRADGHRADALAGHRRLADRSLGNVAFGRAEAGNPRVSGEACGPRLGSDSRSIRRSPWKAAGRSRSGSAAGRASASSTTAAIPAVCVCSHPDNDAIIRLAAELNAVIYIHTWLKVGGKPRRPGGDNLAGEVDADGRGAAGRAIPGRAVHLRSLRRRLGAGRARRASAQERLHRVQRLRPALGAGRLHRARGGRRAGSSGAATVRRARIRPSCRRSSMPT